MFQDPFLRKFQTLKEQADDPARSLLYGDDTREQILRQITELIDSELKPPVGRKRRETWNQKRLEAWQLLTFAVNCADFPDGKVSVPAEEVPDFFAANGCLGIEVTEVHVHEPKYHSIEKKILQARHIYEGQIGPPPRVLFMIDRNVRFADAVYRKLPQHLAKCIPQSIAKAKSPLMVSRHQIEEHWATQHVSEVQAAWPAELSAVVGHSSKYPVPNEGRWDMTLGGVVHSAEIPLQRAISRKDENYQYDRRSSWLLLVIPPLTYLKKPSERHVFDSTFEQVFALWIAEERVIKLKTKKKGLRKKVHTSS